MRPATDTGSVMAVFNCRHRALGTNDVNRRRLRRAGRESQSRRRIALDLWHTGTTFVADGSNVM